MTSTSPTLASAEMKIDGMMCGKNLQMASAAAGAATHYFGLDRTISSLPPPVHWGLAGLMVATNCQSGLTTIPSVAQLTNKTSMQCAMLGAVGGFAFMFIAPRLGL
jgi:hypothetical protein